MKTIDIIEEFGAFIFLCIFIILMLVKGITWKEPQKAKPHIRFGKEIRYVGHIGEKFGDSVTYNKRQWFTYCPAIHKKPKKWGTYKK